MRIGVTIALSVALGASSSVVLAEPRDNLEASGFAGIDYFGSKIGLGGAQVPEQRPQTAPMFGARLTYVPLSVGQGGAHFDLGLEAELTFTPSWTGYGFDGPRPSVFAPVLGYTGDVLLRLGGPAIQPHVTLGGGGKSVTSSSEYMNKDTDPVGFWGIGATVPMQTWQLRVDGRQGFMEDFNGNISPIYEAHVSIGARWGGAKKPPVEKEKLPPVEPPPVVVSAPPPPKDSDNDGILDNVDVCPEQAESPNGIEDQDGCPEPDPDGDGLVASNDKCPTEAEDKDGFEDEDGCPDLDNDKDGIADASDKCPLEPETLNGITDDDGCADQIPPAITAALAAVAAAKFDAGKPRIKTDTKKLLDKVAAQMLANKRMKFTITVHPEKAGDETLAQKRADGAKWYLVEQGAAADNLTTVVGPVTSPKGPILEMSAGK